MTTLRLVMIVKNEADIIVRSISSVKNIIDSYTIIDTGSTDNTIEIIKEALKEIPGEIYQRPWKNFGYNRTEALQLAFNKSDYILLLDADEVIKVEKEFDKNKLDKDFYYLRYQGNVDYAAKALINNRISWQYFGVTHEYIDSQEIKTYGELNSLKLFDFSDGNNKKDKFQRDVQLLLQGIKDEPNNRRYYFYLARSYYDGGNYSEAIKYFQKRIEFGGFPEEVYYSYYQIGRCYERLDNFEEAKKYYLKAYEYRPTRAESIYTLVILCLHLKEYNQAYIYGKIGLEIKYPKKDVLFIIKNIYTYLMLYQKSVASYWVGKYNEAIDECNKLSQIEKIPQVIQEQNLKNLQFSLDKIKEITIKPEMKIDKELATEALMKINKVLQENKIRPFLIGGTLLGCIREKDFLSHDEDVDVGVAIEEWSPEIIPILTKAGFSFKCQMGTKEEGLEYRFFYQNLQIDIFFFYTTNDKKWLAVFENKKTWYKYLYNNFDLELTSFRGMSTFIPTNAESFLEQQYGDWKVEKKEWNYLTNPKNIQLIE